MVFKVVKRNSYFKISVFVSSCHIDVKTFSDFKDKFYNLGLFVFIFDSSFFISKYYNLFKINSFYNKFCQV